MADVERMLASGGWAIVGVVTGASLTYLFNILNRRHQEKKEKDTRWYDTRLQAYIELYQAAYETVFTVFGTRPSKEVGYRLGQRLFNALGTIHFVGSPEVIKAAEKVLDRTLDELGPDKDMSGDFLEELQPFQVVARRDLGH